MLADILRSFRLGVINLLGVTVPGVIVILLILFGFLAPVICLINDQFGANLYANSILSLLNCEKAPLFLISILLLTIAYIIGYIFRLSTPDDLDKISTERVIKKMGGPNVAKKDHWPHQGEKDNKFPYFHFKGYLQHRKHTELLPYIKWDKNIRSKIFINFMKLETFIRSPHLSAIIESNEAHIRLLFGTWCATKLCIFFVYIGLILSIIGGLFCKHSLVPFIVLFISNTLVTVGSFFIINQIQNLFHYRRVRELFDIVACYHLAISRFDSSGEPK